MMRITDFFRDAKPSGQLLGLCFLLLLGFIFSVGLSMVMTVDKDIDGGIPMLLAWQGLMQLCIFLLPALAFAALYQGRVGGYFGMRPSWNVLGRGCIAIVILLLLLPLTDWITWWNQQWELGAWGAELRKMADMAQQQVEQMLSLTSAADVLLQLLVVALVPAVCEELLFRGCLQQTLVAWTRRPHLAIVITAMIFSLAHGDIFGLVPRLILGLLLGYVYYYGASIWINIMVHFFNNAMVVVMYYLYHQGWLLTAPDAPLQMPWLTTALCAVGGVALFWLYFCKTKQEKMQS